jgi:oligoribonuclease
MSNIAWLDLETTGLDEQAPGASIVEIGVIITDENLKTVNEATWIVSPRAGVIFDDMAWEMHDQSGLIADLEFGLDIVRVEQEAEEFIVTHCDEPPEMGGNTLGFDRRWLAAQAPRLGDAFHYRNLDVSVLRSFARRWRPELTANEPKGEPPHRALPDLRNSIRLAGYYRKELFGLPT